jgi:pimeloyl-ACP methyl ester carboxylesterase
MIRSTIFRLAIAVTAAWVAVAGPARAQEHTAVRPTIVLVHGAFAESASWNGVAGELIAHGYTVIAVANPLRGVRSDAAYLTALIRAVPGPIVLVAHSYGGSVITAAADDTPNVTALVYVSGLAPDEGETASALTDRFPGSSLGPTLAPSVKLPDGGEDLYIRQDRFVAQFAPDVPHAEAVAMAATQRPIRAAAFTEVSGPPAWKHIPSWFIYGTADKNIPPALQVFQAKRANARALVGVKGASHVVMISHPHAVASLIEQAAVAR